jgi:hypothetical protein
MPRGLGSLQKAIKRVLDRAIECDAGALTFNAIRMVFAVRYGGDPNARLNPTHERSLKRALKLLVDRGDVLIIGGEGGQKDPYRYITVEAFAESAEGRKVNTAEAKKICAALRSWVSAKRAARDVRSG